MTSDGNSGVQGLGCFGLTFAPNIKNKDIYVRESGSQNYLVLQKPDDSEEAWKIADDDTLIRGGELVSITLKRIKN